MKKTLKIMSIILVVMMVVFSLSTNVMAVDDVLTDIKGGITFEDKAGIGSLGGYIANILSIIGIVVAVIVLLVLGIKYMMGSASEKAEYKKTMIPYLVGAALIFGASAIVNVVVNTVSKIEI